MAGEDALFQRFGKEFKRGDVLFREGDPGKDTPQGKLVNVNLQELHGRMGLTPDEVQEAVTKTAKARIIAVVPEGVVVPDLGKMQKYLDFLEMKERFGD